MNEKIFFEWSYDTIVITIITAIIIIGSLLYLYKEFIDTDSRLKKIGAVAIAIFLTSAEIYFTGMTPLYVEYNQTEICIKHIIGRDVIPYSEIISIKSIEPQTISNSTRQIASGGAGGYVGLFHNQTLGRYYMYATAQRDLVLIVTQEKKYVFNHKERNALVGYVEQKI